MVRMSTANRRWAGERCRATTRQRPRSRRVGVIPTGASVGMERCEMGFHQPDTRPGDLRCRCPGMKGLETAANLNQGMGNSNTTCAYLQ